jgi:AraC-like DNA-binding protein
MPDSVYFGEVTYPPGGACGPRRQHSVQFVIVHSGQAEVTFGREKHTVAAGHVCRVWPGVMDLFEFPPPTPTHHTWVDLDYVRLPRGLRPALKRTPFCLRLTRRMQGILELGLQCQQSGGPASQAILRHLAAAFCHAFLDAATNASSERPLPPAIQKARRYGREHLAEPVQLADLAKAANVSSYHLVRLFRQHLKTTPMRWLWQMRVQRGSELLSRTGLGIAEVAYQVGFASPYHFSRQFRAQMGMAPRTWRQQTWGDPSE